MRCLLFICRENGNITDFDDEIRCPLYLWTKVILYLSVKLPRGQYHYAKHNITAKQYHSPPGEYN